VARWLAAAEDATIQVPIQRADIDHLFFAVTGTSVAVAKLQECLILLSQGKTPEADEAMKASQNLVTNADTRMRQFMKAMMAKFETVHGK
jgi:hypothetical protein